MYAEFNLLLFSSSFLTPSGFTPDAPVFGYSEETKPQHFQIPV